MAQTKTGLPKAAPLFDDVLKRMLSTPPDSKKSPQSKSKKKISKKKTGE